MILDNMGRLQSGQMQRTVNPSSPTSMVRIRPFPPLKMAINLLNLRFLPFFYFIKNIIKMYFFKKNDKFVLQSGAKSGVKIKI